MKTIALVFLISITLTAQTIVCLGTSLTAACQYPTVLQRELPGAKVINMGMGGKNSNTLKYRIIDVINANPDYVIYESVINDSYSHPQQYDKVLSLQECRANLQMICDSLKRFHLFFMTMQFPYDSTILGRNPSQDRLHFFYYNELFKKVARENNIPIIDVLPDWLEINYLDYAPDGLHSNARAASELTVKEIMKALKQGYAYRITELNAEFDIAFDAHTRGRILDELRKIHNELEKNNLLEEYEWYFHCQTY